MNIFFCVYAAQYLGLHLVPPFYDGKNSSDVGSVNFAVAGASALPDSYFLSKGIAIRQANVSLWDQLGWFKNKFLPKFQCLEGLLFSVTHFFLIYNSQVTKCDNFREGSLCVIIILVFIISTSISR